MPDILVDLTELGNIKKSIEELENRKISLTNIVYEKEQDIKLLEKKSQQTIDAKNAEFLSWQQGEVTRLQQKEKDLNDREKEIALKESELQKIEAEKKSLESFADVIKNDTKNIQEIRAKLSEEQTNLGNREQQHQRNVKEFADFSERKEKELSTTIASYRAKESALSDVTVAREKLDSDRADFDKERTAQDEAVGKLKLELSTKIREAEEVKAENDKVSNELNRKMQELNSRR